MSHPTQTIATDRGRIGLALGSGSARGWAHIGVIRALTEAGVHVDCVAGTSIGALVGGAYAAGEIDALEELALRVDWRQIASFLDVVLPKSGLIEGKKIAEFLRKHLPDMAIEELPLPFRAVATDLATGHEVTIGEGDIIEAIRASISVPGIFTPVGRDGTFLVDGGLVNPVPVSVVRDMGADFVIAVDLNHDIVAKKGIHSPPAPRPNAPAPREQGGESPVKRNKILDALNRRVRSLDLSAWSPVGQWMTRDPAPSVFEVLLASINIMETQITEARLKAAPPDLLIQPGLGHIRFLHFHRAEEAIAEGYREAKDRISALIGDGLR